MTKGLLYDLGLLLPFIFCFVFLLACVHYKHSYYCEIFSEEEFLGEFYKDTFSDCPSNINTRISEDDSSSEYTSDSDDVTIRPTKRLKSFVIQYSLA